MNVKEVLENLEFEKREIEIYLALLKKENMTVLEICREAKIDRTTTYDLLEKMADKGFVSSITLNKTKHINAIKPKELLNIFLEKCTSLERVLPQLNNISQKKDKTVDIQVYQGKKGILTILKQLISSRLDYRVIGINEELVDILGYFNDHGLIEIDKWNIKEQGIVDKKAKFKKAKNGEYHYIDGINFPVTTLLYGTQVIFFFWQQPYFAIKIDSKEFSRAQNKYFELLWNIK